jgi:hypothetical protein
MTAAQAQRNLASSPEAQPLDKSGNSQFLGKMAGKFVDLRRLTPGFGSQTAAGSKY